MIAGEDPLVTHAALETIETASRTALVEMRRLLGVLRTGGGDGPDPVPLEPAPGLRDLDALVADVVKSGVTVEMRVLGERPEAVRDAPAAIEPRGHLLRAHRREPGMRRLVRAEFLKLRVTRLFLGTVAAVPIVCTLVTIAVVVGSAGHEGNAPLGPRSLAEAIGAPASIVTAVALLLGVLGVAGEYRHQTITTTFLAAPDRRAVVAAKLVTHAIVGLAIASVAVALTAAIAVPWLHRADVAVHVDGDVVRVAAGFILSTALYGALGVAIGALVHNQTAAVATVLLWLLAIEGLIGNVFRSAAFLQWLPVAAGRAMVRLDSADGSLPAWGAAPVFASYVIVLAGAASRLVTVRDVT